MLLLKLRVVIFFIHSTSRQPGTYIYVLPTTYLKNIYPKCKRESCQLLYYHLFIKLFQLKDLIWSIKITN